MLNNFNLNKLIKFKYKINNMKTFLEVFLVAILTLGFVALILGLPLMWLWNWIMPELFYLNTITFWQAVGLNLLTGILFRSSYTKK